MDTLIQQIYLQFGLLNLALFVVAGLIIRYLFQVRDKRTDLKLETQKLQFQSELNKREQENQARYTKLEQELQANLEPKIHISKAKYDLELEIYQELWSEISEISSMLRIQMRSDFVSFKEQSFEEKMLVAQTHHKEIAERVKKLTYLRDLRFPFYDDSIFKASIDFTGVVSEYVKNFPKTEAEINEYLNQDQKDYDRNLVRSFSEIRGVIRKRLNDVAVI